MRRTLILTALGAATLSIGVGATMAEANSTQNIPIDQLAACEAASTSMMGAGNAEHMQHDAAMASMMKTSMMMAPMMGGPSPVASHTAHTAHTAHHQEVQP